MNPIEFFLFDFLLCMIIGGTIDLIMRRPQKWVVNMTIAIFWATVGAIWIWRVK